MASFKLPSNLHTFQQQENTRNIEEVQKRLSSINEKIREQEKREKSKIPLSAKDVPSSDWTTSYQKWEGWVDMEDLLVSKEATEAHMESLYDKKDALGHLHDHSKEREFFTLPEQEKVRKCEQYRDLGNYLFHEGMFDRAAIQYKTAIGFYEYIFPDDDETQSYIDTLRCQCLCNIALCFLRMEEYRKAIEACSTAIESNVNSTRTKALFRRGLAYRGLDEYEKALTDFRDAKVLEPEDDSIENEIQITKKLMQGYLVLSKEFADASLNSSSRSAPAHSLPEDIRNKLIFLNKWKPIEPALGEEAEEILDFEKWLQIN